MSGDEWDALHPANVNCSDTDSTGMATNLKENSEIWGSLRACPPGNFPVKRSKSMQSVAILRSFFREIKLTFSSTPPLTGTTSMTTRSNVNQSMSFFYRMYAFYWIVYTHIILNAFCPDITVLVDWA